MRRNSPNPASAIARAKRRLYIMPRTLRSSIVITLNRRTRSVVVLSRKSLRVSGDSGVEPCHFEPLPGASPAPILAPAQDAAGPAQFAQNLVQRLERLDPFTGAQDRQRFQ